MGNLKIISYDLKGKNKDYTNLITAIKEERNWWHYLDSFWLLDTSKTVEELNQKLIQYLDAEDRLIILDLNTKDFNGWLPQNAYDWLKKHINDNV